MPGSVAHILSTIQTGPHVLYECSGCGEWPLNRRRCESCQAPPAGQFAGILLLFALALTWIAGGQTRETWPTVWPN